MTSNAVADLASTPYIQSILKAGGEVYLVGGNVRDRLLGLKNKDHDLLVRKLPFDRLIEALKSFGQANTVGKSFGVVKFRPRGSDSPEIDFSLPRVEKSTGQGHKDFEVDFDPEIPVERDLARRDFTINAMALNVNGGQIIDPFNGQGDLKSRVLRQVFKEAFIEDPLRMIRGIQFAARFNLQLEESTLAAMREHAGLIRSVSKERVIEEIRKLFIADRPSVGFDIMRDTGLLPILFPFVQSMIGVLQPMKQNEDVYQHTMKVLDASRAASELEKPGDLNLMFAALLHDAGKPNTVRVDKDTNKTTFFGHQNVSKRIARKWLSDYRATGIGLNVDKVLNLVENHMFETKAFYSDKAIRRFVNKVGKDNIFDLIDLRIADKKGGRYPDSMKGILNLRSRIQNEINKKVPFGVKDLAINGHDLISLGFKPGPVLGQIQAFLVEAVLDEPEKNTKEALQEIVLNHFKPETPNG